MRQKIVISAALMHDPAVVLFDEPETGLDVATTLMLRHLVRMLAARGKAILYSSHILEVVERVCDKRDRAAQGGRRRRRLDRAAADAAVVEQLARRRVLAAGHSRRSRNRSRAIWPTCRRRDRVTWTPPDTAQPYVLLTKLFLRQFLENDLFSPDGRSLAAAGGGRRARHFADAVHQRVHVGGLCRCRS